MARNLVVCCDGTWNRPNQKDRDRMAPSNVVKIARAMLTSDAQPQPYYDPGVGTGHLDRWTGGGLGFGVSENIKQAYRHIADHRQDDDRLFLFGFSRGAYTVRSLAGLLSTCGLTPPDDPAAVEKAYQLYRQAGTDAGAAAAERFKAGQRQAPVHFIGVWDTVGALGIPALTPAGALSKAARALTKNTDWAHGFHNTRLGDDVTHAYHAVSIDERRGPFKPALWQAEEGESERQNVEQVWFAGVHSNVGGGYADAGLSDHALMWMAAKAMEADLRLEGRYLAWRLDPNAHGELRESMSWFYQLIPEHARRIGQPGVLNERIHASAHKRYLETTNYYAPDNLVTALQDAKSAPITDTGLDIIERIRAASHADHW